MLVTLVGWVLAAVPNNVLFSKHLNKWTLLSKIMY